MKFQALRVCFTALPLVAVSAVIASASPAMAVTTWNWSFSYDSSTYGSGTFTTADVTPTANTNVTVTGISGSITESGTNYIITSLGSVRTNIFQWNGTSTSPLITGDYASGGGISMNTAIGTYKLDYSDPFGSGFAPVDSLDTPTTGYSFLTSSVAPVFAPSGAAPAPGPLPLFGAAAAFGASRRLRQRIQLHKSSPLA